MRNEKCVMRNGKVFVLSLLIMFISQIASAAQRKAMSNAKCASTMRNEKCVMRNGKVFVLSLLIMFISQIASAAQIEPVTDQAGVLKATEVELLNQRIRSIEQLHKIKIGVVFVESIGGRDMVSTSNALLDQYFSNGLNGGIILLVAMDKRKYEMATDRRMVNIITDFDGIPYLKDKIQSSLTAGEYYGAVNNFIAGVDDLLDYYETNGGAYGTLAPEGFDPMAASGAVMLSIFIGLMIRSSLIGKMSNIRHARAAIDYLQKKSIRLTENRDTFLFMNVQRRRRAGGGNRGGGGHGDGGHGGGGGSF